jgi:anti-anti-sigma regulatory factor
MALEKQKDSLMAAQVGQTLAIRLVGRGSFKISPALKRFIHQVVGAGNVQQILIDMTDCIGMDSTFMGMLAGLSGFLRKQGSISLKLVYLSEKNQKLLSTLGVDRVVAYSSSATPEEEALLSSIQAATPLLEDELPSDKLDAVRTALEAHQSLADISEENQTRFRSVLELLQEDLNTLSQP